jgi:hypothetical protein
MEEIDLSYVPTAEMLADCFTKPMPKPALLKQCAAMGMIGIGLGTAMASGRELVLILEMVAATVMELVSELEKASEMPSGSRLIDWAHLF